MALKFNRRKRIYGGLLIACYLLSSYYAFGGWWNASVGTVLILVLSYLIWKKKFLVVTGLKLSFKTIVISVLGATALLIIFYFTTRFQANNNQVYIKITNWRSYYHDIFYTLNEEIMTGAVILYLAVKKFRLQPLVASILLALVFALVHYIFFRWVFLQHGILSFQALTTLLFFGVFRNNLILKTGHIGYSWALHFSWIAIMLGCTHFYKGAENMLSDYEKFNLYLGSPVMLTASFLPALTSIFLISGKKTRAEN